MQYLISRQYLRDKPFYFGAFSSLNFAKEMINIKIQYDETTNRKIIYRIHHHDQIIFEHDQWNTRAPEPTMGYPPTFKYKIHQMLDKRNSVLIGELDEISDAQDFISHRLLDDSKKSIEITYRLFQANHFLSEHNQSSRKDEEAANAKSDKNNALAFRPTPLPTTPSLGPRSFLVQPNKDDEEEKE